MNDRLGITLSMANLCDSLFSIYCKDWMESLVFQNLCIYYVGSCYYQNTLVEQSFSLSLSFWISACYFPLSGHYCHLNS